MPTGKQIIYLDFVSNVRYGQIIKAPWADFLSGATSVIMREKLTCLLGAVSVCLTLINSPTLLGTINDNEKGTNKAPLFPHARFPPSLRASFIGRRSCSPCALLSPTVVLIVLWPFHAVVKLERYFRPFLPLFALHLVTIQIDNNTQICALNRQIKFVSFVESRNDRYLKCY